MLFTNDKEIESPRPVPSNTRVELESAWKKGSKMCFWTSSSMPIPVSITLNSNTISRLPREHRGEAVGDTIDRDLGAVYSLVDSLFDLFVLLGSFSGKKGSMGGEAEDK